MVDRRKIHGICVVEISLKIEYPTRDLKGKIVQILSNVVTDTISVSRKYDSRER